MESETVTPVALEAMERANIDMLVSTARRYPRSVAECKRKALELATLDPETAAECFYKIKRGGKVIEGPSVRLAEIIASTWQNIRAGSRVTSEGQSSITAQAFCHDLENNVFIAREVERRITTSEGARYGDDLITLTKNAGCSIALRNAIFSVIPRALVKPIYESAKQCAVGDLKTLAERRGKATEYFNKLGIGNERIYHTLNVKGMEDIGLAELELLTGLKTAVTDKEITLDEAFPVAVKESKLVDEPSKKAAPGKPEETKKDDLLEK